VKPKRPSYDFLLVLSEAGSESHFLVWAFQICVLSVLSLWRVPCDWKNSRGGMVWFLDILIRLMSHFGLLNDLFSRLNNK
jgi:hypothetical protein